MHGCMDKAIEACNNHKDWNVINIYQTGWRHEVCVFYYTCTDALKQEWKPSDEQMVALDGICSYIRNKADWEISQDTIYELYSLSEQLKKLSEE